jgi:hypothetical protein
LNHLRLHAVGRLSVLSILPKFKLASFYIKTESLFGCSNTAANLSFGMLFNQYSHTLKKD